MFAVSETTSRLPIDAHPSIGSICAIFRPRCLFGYLLILKAYYLFWKDNEYGVKIGDAKRLNVCSVEVCVLLIRGER